MRPSRAVNAVLGWFRKRFTSDHSRIAPRRGPRDHVVILDGTLSSLDPGHETNAGLLYRLLQELNGEISLYYENGLQWEDWRSFSDIMLGRGINRQIKRAYGYLASRYRPGDHIFLFGYSRGAFAVRSLAGVIDSIGLLQAEHATERNIRQAYRLYRDAPESAAAGDFTRLFCHPDTVIEVVGVWDTVKALGLRLPLLWHLNDRRHGFHSDQLGPAIRHGFHALAYHERRVAYAPVLWSSAPEWNGRLEQVWFRGVHGDIGGQLRGFEEARPLSNIPFVWMLERSEGAGLRLPEGWKRRFVQDVTAPSRGNWRGWGIVFWHRRRRVIGADPSERLHETLQDALTEAERSAVPKPLLTRL
ncbi:DUF2235 domain-containing protein [Marivita sp. GX14005]|uniref:DUF2235 domain-containing protein n=1 Tax=Marivita sp. GX14005 TaxID=2942276 RepID=UPI0020196B34|nr:DUF2235 domain-containing protein [Marivita sp. GX14005]MCL3882298.1 DUF2235 domain-containing protein [Marivita sp. GX14005]